MSKKKTLQALIVSIFGCILILGCHPDAIQGDSRHVGIGTVYSYMVVSNSSCLTVNAVELSTSSLEPTYEIPEHTIRPIKPEIVEELETPYICEDDVTLVARLMLCEARGECEEGRRLVIDTILNRVDSPRFPNTIYEVVFQRNSSYAQYSPTTDGSLNKAVATEEACNLVREELLKRSNTEVIFFRTKHYSSSGYAIFKVGAHYFSGCN